MPPEGLGRAEEALQSGRLDWIIFTSSSTVNHLIRLLDEAGIKPLGDSDAKIACLGSVTAETARQHGLTVSVQPGRQDLEGLVAAVVAHVGGHCG